MQEIKKIKLWGVVKISALFGAVIGIFTAIYYALISRLPQETLIAMNIAQVPVITIGLVLVTIISSIVGYILVGLIGALLYNLFSKLVGGIKVELTELKKKR